jgi:hypothetical protein
MSEYETFVPMTPLIQPGGGITADVEPIMTWGNVASTPLVLGGGLAADKTNKSCADWEPTKPSLATTQGNSSDAVEFDVIEENSREKLAHRAEKKLSDRAKTYKAAGSKASLSKYSKATDLDDASTIMSGGSSVASTATTRSTFDRSVSLTPAARALLEANRNNATRKRMHSQNNISSKSRIFQPSPIVSGQNINSAASRDSFGSALRMAYTPGSSASSVKRKRSGRNDRNVSSSIMRAAEGSTPRINK